MSSSEPSPLSPQEKYQRLATAVQARRSWLGLNQLDVHALGGPSNSTLTLIEGAREPRPRAATLRKLDRGLGWPNGMAKQLLDSDLDDDALNDWMQHARAEDPANNERVQKYLRDRSKQPADGSTDNPPRGAAAILHSGLRPDTPDNLSAVTLSTMYADVIRFTEAVRKSDPALANRAVSMMLNAANLYADALAVIEGRRAPARDTLGAQVRLMREIHEVDDLAAHDEPYSIEDEQGHDEHP